MNSTDIQHAFQRELEQSNVSIQVQAQEKDLHVLIAGEIAPERDLDGLCRQIAMPLACDAGRAWDTLTLWLRRPERERSDPVVHLKLAELERSSDPNGLADSVSSPSSTTPSESAQVEISASTNDWADFITESDEEQASAFAFSQYCFTSNTMLLTHQLPPPGKSVAESVWFVHTLDRAGQEQMFPAIAAFFESSDTGSDRDLLPEELQAWFVKAESFDERTQKSLAVWLSRYCRDPEATVADVQKALGQTPPAPAEPTPPPPVQQHRPKPEVSQYQAADKAISQQVLPLPANDRPQSNWQFFLSRLGEWNALTLWTFLVVVSVLFGATVLTARVQRANHAVIQLQFD